MVEWSLANLAAWSVQAAALVVAGAWLPTKLRLGVPRARLLLFRLLLVGCVGLPLAQPWHPGPAPVAVDRGIAERDVTLDLNAVAVDVTARTQAPAAPSVPLTSRMREWAAAVPWPLGVVAVLAAGTVVRLGWLALGLISLARLRRSSTVIDPPTESIAEAVIAVGVVADFRESSRVPRPVTFGLRAPVVIVPPGFTALDPRQQKAVACHELLHVRRQDWLRTFGDEIVRSLLWFHPGIWWLVEQIHLTAEQTIDRQVVALVGDRRSYLRALLALAESGAGPRLQPAACFLDHGHLRQRVAMLMEEASMSRVRFVASLVFVLAVLAAGGWWSVSAFPLHGAPAPLVVSAPLSAVPVSGGVSTPAPVATNQPPPPAPPTPPNAPPPNAPPAPPAPPPPAPPQQATRPGVATTPAGATLDEATLKRNIQLNPKDLTNYFTLAKVYEKGGDLAKAAATYESAIKAVPKEGAPYLQAAGFYQRQGNFEKTMEVLKRRTAVEPGNPEAHYTMAAYYWEKAYRDQALNEGEKRTYIDQGLSAADRALALKPEYVEALTYKNLLLRSQALLETDPEAQKTLLVEADKLRDQAIALRKANPPKVVAGVGTLYGAPPPPPPPPPPGKVVAGAPVPPDAPPPPPPPPPRYSGIVPASGVYVPGAATPPEPPKVVAGAPVPPDAPPPPPPPVGPDGTAAPVRVGGNIKAPVKLVDAKAVMPEEARAARVQGVVIVEALIGTDGKVHDAKVLRSIPMLDQAALDAVKQWEFTVTLLNGVPVPVVMTVTVNFTVDQ
jgi:periplasmic protein TonB